MRASNSIFSQMTFPSNSIASVQGEVRVAPLASVSLSVLLASLITSLLAIILALF
mgnify:FL=1